MKTDYPELEGKKIKWIYGDFVIDAVVVGVCYNVGITIVQDYIDNKHPINYLTCLSYRDHTHTNYTKKTYREIFHCAVKMIKSGEYKVDEMCKLDSYYQSLSKTELSRRQMAMCAFQ